MWTCRYIPFCRNILPLPSAKDEDRKFLRNTGIFIQVRTYLQKMSTVICYIIEPHIPQRIHLKNQHLPRTVTEVLTNVPLKPMYNKNIIQQCPSFLFCNGNLRGATSTCWVNRNNSPTVRYNNIFHFLHSLHRPHLAHLFFLAYFASFIKKGLWHLQNHVSVTPIISELTNIPES